MTVGNRLVDEQRFRRAAYADPPHLGVDNDRLGHVEISGAIDIDVTNAFEVGKHWHPRLPLNALDQALAATGHNDVDRAVEASQHLANCVAVAGRHGLD